MACSFDYRTFENDTFDVCAPIPPAPVVEDVRRLGPSTVIYREGEISYWWERRQRVEDEELLLL